MNILALIALVIAVWIGWRFYSNRHNLPCPAWLSWMVELDNPFAKAHKANEIIQMLPLKNGARILDIGCGPGRVLLPLAKKISLIDGHVTGLDIQADMIKKTRFKAEALGVTNVDFINSSIDEAKIDEPYDIILMICVLGEIPKNDRKSVMQKIARYLQPNGIISITETIFDPHFQSRKYVSEIMHEIGFVENKYIGNRLAYTSHFNKKEDEE
ncbi:MAG: class I SAM-dependent methyltransferase [Candidatus Dependentiae bacterium]|nr:class I SAM-dependent methyltransferase [Candidatus Dependentiae bacterium]